MAASALVALSLMGGTQPARAQQRFGPAEFTHVITNPYFPISLFTIKIFEGREEGDDGIERTRIESRTLTQTRVVMGITVTVLQESEYVDGEIVEVAHDFFAQHRRTGDVYYFGEDVDNYRNGRIANHNGAWVAGVGRNEPGIIMLAQPRVGQTYQQEFAPGEAEDRGTVMALDETVKVPAGEFSGCVKIKDTTPLEPDVEEFKWFCPGIGMVREEGDDSFSNLVDFTRAAAAPAAASPTPPAIAAPQTLSGVVPLPQQAAAASAPAAAPASAAPAVAPETVRPPSTGDAGLVGQEGRGSSGELMLMAGVLAGAMLIMYQLRGLRTTRER
jgi:hypothetical protein